MEALSDPATAGSGALQWRHLDPYVWVWVNSTVSLLFGCVLGLAFATIAAPLALPEPQQSAEPLDRATNDPTT